ncbi:MAG: hypothetical protein GXO57_03670 [Thermodesulfobacteria bacterium]|nr:hypothetical protein [Thermodesulfobacteriota bacterium]
MRRVPQRVLILLSFLILYGWISKGLGASFVTSLFIGPDGTRLKNPVSILFKNNKIYVADAGNRRLVSFSLSGHPLVAFNPKGLLKLPIDFAFKGEKELWIIDGVLRGLYKVDFENRKVKSYIIKWRGKRVIPKVIQIVNNNIYILDAQTGTVMIFKPFKNGLKFLKRLIPPDKNFRGFIDFRVRQNGFWGLSRLNRKVYRYYKGRWKSYSLKRISMAPVSIEVRYNTIFILDRFFAKVLILKLPSLKKVGEFGGKGWEPGQMLSPVKVRYLHYNYIGVGDEGNNRIEIFQY